MSSNSAADIGRNDVLPPDDDTPRPTAKRHERGSLTGLVDLVSDWDSPETNDQIARDFDLSPEPSEEIKTIVTLDSPRE